MSSETHPYAIGIGNTTVCRWRTKLWNTCFASIPIDGRLRHVGAYALDSSKVNSSRINVLLNFL